MTPPKLEAAQPPEIEYEIQLSANRSVVWVHGLGWVHCGAVWPHGYRSAQYRYGYDGRRSRVQAMHAWKADSR